MKFRILVECDGESRWWEEYDKPTTDAKQWAKNIIEYFNNTLHENEKPRRLIEVEVLDLRSQKEHDWTKVNAVTVMDKYGSCDVLKCCG